MEKWQIFEHECAEYLQSKYSKMGIDFKVTGGYDSSSSDIQVLKNENRIFSIECKMSAAQCGQFVLFADEKNKRFVFSQHNKTPYNDFAKKIIDEMEKRFELCISSSKDLPIPENVISEWVKDYYLNFKKSKYCITQSNCGYIIFPIEHIDKYFEFSAKYRTKKSGSSNPSKNNVPEIVSLLKNIDTTIKVGFKNSECFADFNYPHEKFILQGVKYRYQFAKDGNSYKIKRLSNTSNANFIVSIRLKEEKQDTIDLQNFERNLIK